MKRIVNKNQLSMLMNLNSLNKLLYSKTGKNLYIHIQKASLEEISLLLSVCSI